MYPTPEKSERHADGVIHALGILGAVVGAAALIFLVSEGGSAARASAIIYGATLIVTFVASGFYHMAPWHSLRPLLRRIDHAAIYLKIAGTYTPLVVIINTGFAYVVLGVVWALAMIGLVRKLFFWRTPGPYDPALYLIMGWLSVALIRSLWPIVPAHILLLIAAGGLLYTGGVVFYAAENLKFSTAIWHGLVIIASGCFFVAIALSIA